MSDYTDTVAHALRGLEGVSFGICPGCDECRRASGDYDPREDMDYEGPGERWTFPAREEETFPTEGDAEAAARTAFSDDWASGDSPDEGGFSWSDCGICGSTLGGDRYVYHYLDPRGPDGRIYHETDGCVDCLVYISNGDEPEGEES